MMSPNQFDLAFNNKKNKRKQNALAWCFELSTVPT